MNINLSKKKFFLISILFFIQLNFSAIYLNYEIVNHDMSTFLIAGQDILRGNLPYENQYEIKGPILYLAYAFLIKLASGNYLVIKLLFSLLIFLISYILFSTVHEKTQNLKLSFISSLIFLMLMSSKGLGQAGYSELIALVFLSLSFKYLVIFDDDSKAIQSGILSALSTLTSFGTIFFMPVVTAKFIIEKKYISLKKVVIGFVTIHLGFLFLYIVNNNFKLYKFALSDLPIQYTDEKLIQHNLHHYILMVTEEIRFFDKLLSISIILLIFSIFKNYNFLLLILASFTIFYVSGTGAVHYLIFFAYFFCMSFITVEIKIFQNFLLTSALILNLIFLMSFTGTAITTFRNLPDIYENYPIRNLALELSSQNINKDFEVLAYKNHLILFYLNKPNVSYAIHPSLAANSTAIESFRKYLNIDNTPDTLISQNPKYIFCNINLINCKLDNYKEIEYIIGDKEYIIYELDSSEK